MCTIRFPLSSGRKSVKKEYCASECAFYLKKQPYANSCPYKSINLNFSPLMSSSFHFDFYVFIHRFIVTFSENVINLLILAFFFVGASHFKGNTLNMKPTIFYLSCLLRFHLWRYRLNASTVLSFILLFWMLCLDNESEISYHCNSCLTLTVYLAFAIRWIFFWSARASTHI